jgi:hypothetical protein
LTTVHGWQWHFNGFCYRERKKMESTFSEEVSAATKEMVFQMISCLLAETESGLPDGLFSNQKPHIG